ncbi:MAG: exodeoxyribonuclease V subunit alpha [Opitutae bacterium]
MNWLKEDNPSAHILTLGRAISSFFESRESADHVKTIGLLCERLTHALENGLTHLLAHEYEDICANPLVYSAIGEPSEDLPMVCTFSGNLYFRRYYEYEQEISDALSLRASHPSRVCSTSDLEFFTQHIAPRLDPFQSLAVGVGMQKNLLLLTGGPGSGKTYTLAHLLACMFVQSPGISVALTAPTGKSAHRMRQSIFEIIASSQLPEELREKLKVCARASTLHRLLGSVHGSVYFKHNSTNPLPFDLVIVDEASMVDLPLMAKLCSALGKDTLLILVGDADQLSPVQGGAVFNSLVRYGSPNRFSPVQKSFLSHFSKVGEFDDSNNPLHGCMVSLAHVHRRSKDSETGGIGALCDAIREGRSEDVLKIAGSSDQSVRLIESLEDISINEILRKGYHKLVHSETPEGAIGALGRFRILCAHNQGRYGVDGWNERVGKLFPQSGEYALPLIINSNDYSLGLFNGDDGVLVANDLHYLCEDGIRQVSQARLPRHTIGYASSIHRSQGSEFDRVLIVLPPADARLLTRELLYVAVSRAKSEVVLVGDPNSLVSAVNCPEKSRCGVINLLD